MLFKDAFKDWVKVNKLEDEHKRAILIQEWENIAGKTIAKHTTELKVHFPKIYIKLDNAPLKHQLHLDGALLLDKINQYIGEVCINEVVLV